MIDLTKERELFESKFKKSHWVEYDEKRNKYFCPYVDDSEANKYDLMWKVWQLSANREGYKLVPVEPTEDMLDAARHRQWDDLSSPYEDMDMLKYKAMLEVVE